jgi:hypothetical protein
MEDADSTGPWHINYRAFMPTVGLLSVVPSKIQENKATAFLMSRREAMWYSSAQHECV